MLRHSLPLVVLVSLLAASAQPVLGKTLKASKTSQASPASSRAAAKGSAVGTVNLNTASAGDLEALPGIGAKTAARIVEYRQKNGPFKKVEELMNVRGVGEKNFLKLKPQISVGAPKVDVNASTASK
jgi:competence protein ComEA